VKKDLLLGFTKSFDLNEKLGYQKEDHSKEFRSNVIDQWQFYFNVMVDLGFRQPSNP